jgi:surface antigen
MAAHLQFTGLVDGTPMLISTWSGNFKMGLVSTVAEVASDGTISSAETTKFVNLIYKQ